MVSTMSLTIRKDVTAVKFFKSYVLAGIGSYANIFDKYTGKQLQRCLILKSENIYGFVISRCEESILVFGKKQFAILDLVEKDGIIVKLKFETQTVEDWIQSAIWDGDNVSLLTCHNAVMKINIKTRETQTYKFPDYSLLYSGLLLPVADGLMILAGTVYSEVVIRRFRGEIVMHRLKGHRGVIFSISCDPHKGIIVTTSDDRSLRVWGMLNPKNHSPDTIEFWENIDIKCRHELYGHTARVMRNVIVDDLIISGGEDASICYWGDGNLIRKVESHQTASIWCMDCDGKNLITGGGDGAVILHPLTVASDYGDKNILEIEGTVKLLNFTARRNIISLNTNSDVIYYDVETKLKIINKLLHESTYKMMALSSCKQIIAIADMLGKLDVFVENCKDKASITNLLDTKLDIGKISSMHFAGNRHLVLCAEDGNITVLATSGSDVDVYAKFILPPCKERWLTTCAIDPVSGLIFVADRCSGIHCFSQDQKNPIKSFNKVHGRYGSTSLTIKNDVLISTGRDGTIKYFAINRNNFKASKYMSSRDLDFNWVEKFLDKDENLICGFQESTFIVYNLKSNSKIIQTVCGGGHRAYDAIRFFKKINDNIEEFIQLVYLKNSTVYLITYQLSLIVSKPIINGSQSKSINSMNVIQFPEISTALYISGGEDTTLRISTVDKNFDFKDQLIYKHLSNVRTVKVIPCDGKWLVLSAGGRAQICLNSISIEWSQNELNVKSEELTSLMLKGSDETRKNNKNWRNQEVDFDPETRIMDLDVIEDNNITYFIFAGCSDAILRVFAFNTENNELKPLKEVKYCDACILKVACIKLSENLNILATCLTTGQVIIWNIVIDKEDINLIPSEPIRPHRAGVNCIDFRVISDNKLLIATGGDDNSISLMITDVQTFDSGTILESNQKYCSSQFPCSQVTGIAFFAKNLLVCASIDQRVTLLRWTFVEDGLEVTYLNQVCSDVADIQGLEILQDWKHSNFGACENCDNLDCPKSLRVCVYGKGFEVLQINVPPH